MIPNEILKMKNILDSFLGEPKSDITDSCQLEYPCPRCVENYGNSEIHKYNCSISLKLQRFNCWKCSDEGEDMHGSIIKLIRKYGNEKLLHEYKEAIESLRESKLYKANFSDAYIKTDVLDKEALMLPSSFRLLKKDAYIPKNVEAYLKSRGIGWDIIDKYNIGYTLKDNDNYMSSFRIYIPSYDKFGELNYWTGRDYLNRDKVVKYFNPKVERKDIIFNEDKLQWDADITIVEGPFDHIVVPNSVPLLGKVLNKKFKLYWDIVNKANANVNIFLDGDAFDAVKVIYKELNHGRLYGKIRYIPVQKDLDPSKIYELYSYKGIISYLKGARKIPEIEL